SPPSPKRERNNHRRYPGEDQEDDAAQLAYNRRTAVYDPHDDSDVDAVETIPKRREPVLPPRQPIDSVASQYSEPEPLGMEDDEIVIGQGSATALALAKVREQRNRGGYFSQNPDRRPISTTSADDVRTRLAYSDDEDDDEVNQEPREI